VRRLWSADVHANLSAFQAVLADAGPDAGLEGRSESPRTPGAGSARRHMVPRPIHDERPPWQTSHMALLATAHAPDNSGGCLWQAEHAARRYADLCTIREFPDHGHMVISEPGWGEIA